MMKQLLADLKYKKSISPPRSDSKKGSSYHHTRTYEEHTQDNEREKSAKEGRPRKELTARRGPCKTNPHLGHIPIQQRFFIIRVFLLLSLVSIFI